jgi:hypothetical protein
MAATALCSYSGVGAMQREIQFVTRGLVHKISRDIHNAHCHQTTRFSPQMASLALGSLSMNRFLAVNVCFFHRLGPQCQGRKKRK